MMDIEEVRSAAQKMVQGISAIRPMLDLPRVILSKEAQNTNLSSLIKTLGISASVNNIPQVGS